MRHSARHGDGLVTDSRRPASLLVTSGCRQRDILGFHKAIIDGYFLAAMAKPSRNRLRAVMFILLGSERARARAGLLMCFVKIGAHSRSMYHKVEEQLCISFNKYIIRKFGTFFKRRFK